jgi:hypothetical protein
VAECDYPVNFMYPLKADIYFSRSEQGPYGNIVKEWTLDKTVVCSFTPAGTAFKEELVANVDLKQDSLLFGRTRSDIRFTSLGDSKAMTDVIVTNLRDKDGVEIYLETAGPRDGKSTLFEIATIQPFMGPFGKVEYYKIVLRRSENQGTTV